VEDRSTLPNKKLTIKMGFNNTISSVGSASSTCGSVSSISISGNVVTVNLVGVPHGCNGHDVYVTANNVMDDMGNTLSSATATVGLLLGDVNGDRVVDRADRRIVQGNKGQQINSTNFRSDVNNSGFIQNSDVQLVNQQQGTSLP
jgi:Dockerin type I domain